MTDVMTEVETRADIRPLFHCIGRRPRKMIAYRHHDIGTHFAAWEQPQLLREDLRDGFRPLREHFK